MHRKLKNQLLRTFFTAILILSYPYTPYAQEDLNIDNNVFELSLDSLLDIEVTSVSKSAEKISKAASAVYVITQEDIRRSGFTSIPEALRMAPGIHVAQMSSNQWAISARGFNRQFSNKLLVMMDGRTIYNPMFSGVLWDTKDTFIEDIDRIEVVRGPGGTLWGANAVNGVINIITKNAKDTIGSVAYMGTGNSEKGFVGIRTGTTTEDGKNYRIYAKHSDRENYTKASGGNGDDDWFMSRGGFRMDDDTDKQTSFTLQGDVYSGDRNATMVVPVAAGGTTTNEGGEFLTGANILARWVKTIDSNSEASLQTYIDIVDRDQPLLHVSRTTYDIEMQHKTLLQDRNEVTWGAGFRHIAESIDDSTFLNYTPDRRNDSIFNTFIQDKITISPEKLFLTIGSKFEHNEYTGFEIQPNIRASWLIDKKQSAWAAISRAVRTPSRGEDGIILKATGTGSGFITQEGRTNLNSEELVAYELGYKIEPQNNISLDLSAFFNDYGSLRTYESGTPYVDGGDTIVPLLADDRGYGESYGFEIAADWQIQKGWKLAGSYSFITVDLHKDSGSSDTLLNPDENSTPRNLLNLRSYYSFSNQIELDNSVYFVDNVKKADTDAYIRFDTRIGWKPVNDIELSLVGQNLFDNKHKEYSKPLYGVVEEVPRTVYGKVTYSF
jgi:iron complex outermembrane receptor protein